MIDWGILAFFVLQLALTFAIYHGLNAVKAEKSVLVSASERIAEVTSKIDGLVLRMDTLEKGPVERIKQVAGLSDEVAECKREAAKALRAAEHVDAKLLSLNGRIAAKAKAAKRAERTDDEELGPDAEAEGGEQAQAPYPPVPTPREVQPGRGAIPPSFGVVKRTGSHG